MSSHFRNGFFSCFCLKQFQTTGDQKKVLSTLQQVKISYTSLRFGLNYNFLSNQASAIHDCSDQRATKTTLHWSFVDLPLPTSPKHPCGMPQVSKVFLYPWQIVSGGVVGIWVLPLHYWHSPWVFAPASGLLKGLHTMRGSHSFFNPFSEVL